MKIVYIQAAATALPPCGEMSSLYMTTTAGLTQMGGAGGAVLALQTWGSLLLTATAREGLQGWDLRATKKAFSLSASPHQVGHHPQVLLRSYRTGPAEGLQVLHDLQRETRAARKVLSL